MSCPLIQIYQGGEACNDGSMDLLNVNKSRYLSSSSDLESGFSTVVEFLNSAKVGLYGFFYDLT